MFNSTPTLKNVNGEARTLGAVFGWLTLNSAPLYRGDGALLTVLGHTGLRDSPALDIVSGGTVAVTSVAALTSGLSVGSGGTVTTRRGIDVADATGAGTLTTQIGVDIAALAKGGTNIGIRNAATEVATPSVATITAVGNTITANAKVKRLDNTSGSSKTLTSTPTIPDGQDGQLLVLFNSSANDVVLQDQGTLGSSNLRLVAASITIGPRDSVMLMYSSTVADWIQLTPVVAVL